MKTLYLLIGFVPIVGLTQVVSYSPNRKVEITVAETYYDTEFIFLKNIDSKVAELTFEVLENTFDSNWSATFCTNLQCFTNIPDIGSLGTIAPDEEAYISMNFSANETLGSGKVRVLITSPKHKELSDTVTFIYTVTEDGKVEARPWAKVNYAQGVLTVLLENPQIKTHLQVVSLNGRLIFDAVIGSITSIPLRDFPKGMYIIAIKDENDRLIHEKVVHF